MTSEQKIKLVCEKLDKYTSAVDRVMEKYPDGVPFGELMKLAALGTKTQIEVAGIVVTPMEVHGE